MSLKRTYLDSGILIAAARGKGKLAEKALSILTDTSRAFVCSDYVRLEVVPKPTYFGFDQELAFYEEYFHSAAAWMSFHAGHLHQAFEEACASGLSAIDAVHVVLAHKSGCEELVTTEKPGSSIHRTALVKTVSIDTG